MTPYPESEFRKGPRLLRYECGRASWHQRKAGHFCSSVLTAWHTYEQHARYMASAKPDYPILAFFDPAEKEKAQRPPDPCA